MNRKQHMDLCIGSKSFEERARDREGESNSRFIRMRFEIFLCGTKWFCVLIWVALHGECVNERKRHYFQCNKILRAHSFYVFASAFFYSQIKSFLMQHN